MAGLEQEENPAGNAAGRTGWTRVLIAGTVPAGLGVAVWLSASFGAWSHLSNSLTAHLSCQQAKMGCLGAYQSSFLASAFSLPGLSLGLVLAVSYTIAAFLTTPGGHRFWRVGIAVAIIALLPLSDVWSLHQVQPVSVNVQPGTGGSAPSAPAVPATGSPALGPAKH